MDSITPSKLQGTKKLADLIPSKHFLATSSAFIAPDGAAIILVNTGLFLFSAIYNLQISSSSSSIMKPNFMRESHTFNETGSFSVRRENRRDMNIIGNYFLLKCLRHPSEPEFACCISSVSINPNLQHKQKFRTQLRLRLKNPAAVCLPGQPATT